MLSSKIKTLLKDGLDPYVEGKRNFEHPTTDVEVLSAMRAITCGSCRYLKDEPIDFFRVHDAKIPELSGKSCGKCGCILSYKTRQSIKPCSRWQS